MGKLKVYISGGMSDIPRKEYMERFSTADKVLKEHGYDTVNPTRVWVCRYGWMWKALAWFVGVETAYRMALLYDLWLLMMKADRIYRMPGWKDSRGANIESCVAYHMKVYNIGKRAQTSIDKVLNERMSDESNEHAY